MLLIISAKLFAMTLAEHQFLLFILHVWRNKQKIFTAYKNFKFLVLKQTNKFKKLDPEHPQWSLRLLLLHVCSSSLNLTALVPRWINFTTGNPFRIKFWKTKKCVSENFKIIRPTFYKILAVQTNGKHDVIHQAILNENFFRIKQAIICIIYCLILQPKFVCYQIYFIQTEDLNKDIKTR